MATHNPADNISADVPASEEDVPAASDASSVVVPDAEVAKANLTDITETGNTTAQAVVGETLTYTIGVTIPAHTSVYNGELADPMPTGITFVGPATAAYSADGTSPATGALPTGVSLIDAAAGGTLSFDSAYTNDTDDDQLFEVTIPALISTEATNTHGTVRTNTATFTSDTAATGGTPIADRTATSDVTIVEPSPTLTKTRVPDTATVAGGSTVDFTLTAGNASGRPVLQDTVVTDCVPAGLTVGAISAPGGTTATTTLNGCASGTGTLITWTIGDIEGGSTTALTYPATITGAAGNQSYTNTANLTGSSLADGTNNTDPATTERVYTATDSESVQVAGASVTKTPANQSLTIGERGSWTVTVTLPANLDFYDSIITDVLPAGMVVTGLTTDTVSCTGFATCPSLPTLTSSPAAPGPGEATTIGWGVGDVAASATPRTITVEYSADIADLPGNAAGVVRTNTVDYRWNSTDGSTPTSVTATLDQAGDPAAASATIVEPAIQVAKQVSDTTPEPGDTFTYTVTASNDNRANDLSPAYNYTVTDTVPTGVVVDPASLVAGGGVLTGTDANGSGGTITWGPIAGPLAANDSTTFTYDATLAPSGTLTADALTNTAQVTHYESLPSGGRTDYDAVSAEATVTPQFPQLTVAKSAASGPAYLGTSKTWTITLENTGDADARNVSAVDTLPVNWTYDANSATAVVAGGAATQVEPALSTDASGHQVLTWSGLGTAPASGADRTIVVTFTATPTDPDAASDPGVGATVDHTNSVAATAEDATGATGNASGPYAGGPATASTQIHSADVTITKTSGDAVAGQDLTYTLVVANDGPDTAVGPFPVTDTLPSGLGTLTADGTGWTCSVSATTVDCVRTDPADTLASGDDFPNITVTAAIPADTADGTTLINSAEVGSGTYDPDTTNNTDEVTDTVARSADLGIVKNASGTITAGQDATYTLDVTNDGPSDSDGPITVSDVLPSGVTFVSATGTDWSCVEAAGTVTCTRTDGLTSGAAAPQITVVVGVPADRTADLENTAAVDGPETDPNPDNDSDTVTDPVQTSADLALTKVHQGDFVPGDTGTYRFTVINNGPSDAASPVEVTDQLSAELTFVSDDSADWDCSVNGSNLLTCTLPGGLALDATSEFGVTVDIDSAHTGDVTNSATVDSPTDDPNTGNDTDDDTTGVDVRADLGIVKSHTGDATAGQNLTFELEVTNNGRSDSPGTITVTDTLPAGLTYVSASGAGWNCSEDSQEVTCDRAAGLVAGASSTIDLTVAVASAAGPDTITNSANVGGPAPDPDPDNNTDDDDVTVLDQANVRITKSAAPTTVAAGDEVTYTLTVTNDGPSDADNVQVSDTLPAGLTYVGIDADDEVTCADANPVACTVASMPAGASYEIRVDARVGSGVADGTTITNTATVSTGTAGDDPGDNTDDAAIDVFTSADLGITKTHTGGAAVAGEQVTFDLAVTNAGPSDASADVVVTDTLPVGMTYVSSTDTGWTCVAGPPDASGQVVTCTLSGGVAVLAGMDAPALALVVQVDADLDPDMLVDGVLTNEANVTSPTSDPTPGNNSDSDAVSITTSADVSITKTHTGPVRIGDELEFTLQVSNDGPSTARGVSVSDDLPAGLEYVSASGAGWTCTNADQAISCDLDDPLASGASAAPITVTVTVLASAYPTVSNVATVTAATEDPDPDNNESTDPVSVPAQVDLGITKSHTPEPMQVGEQATYTIAVSNAGTTDDPGPITVADTLPAGLTFVSGGGDGWTCAAAGQDVTCTRAAGLATIGNTSFPLVVDVGPDAYPGVTNTAAVSSPAEDTNPLNNLVDDPATVLPLFELEIDKNLTSITSSRATWEIVVTNNGPNESPSGAVVTDNLRSALSFTGYSGDGWTCTAAGRLVTCAYDQPILAGESVSFVLRTSIDADASGRISNSATVLGGTTATATATATGTIPSDVGGLADTGGVGLGAGLAGLLAIALGGSLVAVRRRRT